MLSKNQLKLVRSLELKKNRKKEGLFVAEGPKVVGDLLRAGYVPHAIFSTNPAYLSSYLPASNLPSLQGGAGGRLLPITDDELRKLSFLQHPQEVLALFEIPSPDSLPFREGLGVGSLPSLQGGVGGRPLSLALDGIQDPGNLGTIIRIADWFGINHHLLFRGHCRLLQPQGSTGHDGLFGTHQHRLYQPRSAAAPVRRSHLRHPARRPEHLPARALQRGHHCYGQRGQRHLSRYPPARHPQVAHPQLQPLQRDCREPQRSYRHRHHLRRVPPPVTKFLFFLFTLKRKSPHPYYI